MELWSTEHWLLICLIVILFLVLNRFYPVKKASIVHRLILSVVAVILAGVYTVKIGIGFYPILPEFAHPGAIRILLVGMMLILIAMLIWMQLIPDYKELKANQAGSLK